MGNVLPVELHRDHRVSSIENLKQMPFIESQHQRKKRSIIFNTSTWKRLVESTRKKGSKGSKINPLSGHTDANAARIQNGNLHARHGSGLPAGQDSIKKSQSLYVINTKTPNGLTSELMKPVLQQPRTISTKSRGTAVQDMNSQFKTYSVQQTRLPPTNNPGKTESQHDARVKSSTVISDKNKRSVMQNNGRRTNLPAESGPKPAGPPPRKVVIQASTSELLLCLGKFICRRCRRIDLEPSDIATWLRGVDRTLLMQGWQDITFIMPSSVVFVYMLCREMIPESVSTVFEVQCIVLTCLYMSYSYMGNEISYPLRPFLIEPERYAFWSRCCRIMDKLSGKMLRINNDAQYFTTVFRDLKGYSSSTGPAPPYASQTPRSVHPPSITAGGR